MADNPNAFKHALGKPAIQRIAGNIRRVESAFDQKGFVRAGCEGLNGLELKARVDHLVSVLRQFLPENEREAIALLVRAGASWERDEVTSTSGFAAWPMIEFVGEHGLGHFSESMEALRKLTGLFSAEFAIRNFIERYQVKALKLLAVWTNDPSEHVRRLVSEGTRPRLPWGKRLRSFQNDPAPVLKLLEKLKNDESEYVRRSVANNLNDIAKDHPDVVIDVCKRWSKDASPERQWIVKRATRTLVKDGHPEVMKLLGFDPAADVVVDSLSLQPGGLKVGEDLAISFGVRSRSGKQIFV
ncbi:MAG: DNA alkylation repair protein, partial [Planctomycetes bacterium]|nr:DNA alkylation repair protein [Planctomycetota bacterium]